MADKKNTAAAQTSGKQKKKETLGKITLRRLAKDPMARIGFVIIVIMILASIFANVIAPYDYTKMDLMSRFQPPSWKHLFGTDEMGRDIFSRMLIGSRYSLSIGIITVALSAVVGIAIGAICGYYGGTVDTVVMRLIDVVQAIPRLVLAIAISAAMGAGFRNCILALAISGIPTYVRMARASVMNIRKMEFLEAASAINCTDPRIIFRHVLPNALSPLIVQMTMGIASGIIAASQLSFVGLGVQPPEPEWGAMLSAGRSYIRDHAYLTTCPGLVIMTAVLAMNMIGDALRDALDPKLKD